MKIHTSRIKKVNYILLLITFALVTGAFFVAPKVQAIRTPVDDSAGNQVKLQAELFLQGAYNTTTANMNNSLTASNLIPSTAPYSESPRQASSVPTTTTDWVLVQLRQTPTSEPLVSKSFFLSQDGQLINDDGSSPVILEVAAGDYYLIVRHRNHLAVMSAQPVAFGSGVAFYDFTTSSNKYYGNNGAKEIAPGVWGMWAADMNHDELIDTKDYDVWWAAVRAGASGYVSTDANLDGEVTTSDYTKYYNNSRAAAKSQVPEPIPAQPDLIIQDFSWRPVSPQVGETDPYLYVDFTVANNGDGQVSLNGTTYSLYRNGLDDLIGQLFAEKNQYTLQPGETYTYQNMTTLQNSGIKDTAGTFKLIMEADSEDAIVESDETNNTLTKTITIGPSKPDLVVSSLSGSVQEITDSGGNQVSAVKIDYCIKNIGNADIDHNNFFIKFTNETLTQDLIESQYPGGVSIAGQEYCAGWSRPGRLVDGKYIYQGFQQDDNLIKASVDSKDQISELDEQNNSRTATVTIPETKKPDLTLENFEWNLLPADPNWDVMFEFDIVNRGEVKPDSNFKLKVTNVSRNNQVIRETEYAKIYFEPNDYKARVAVPGKIDQEFNEGENIIRVIVDSENSVAESNENNNELEEKIYVRNDWSCSNSELISARPRRDTHFQDLHLDISAHPEILRYRIQWFNGGWSPWYVPGVDDIDWKTNYDGTPRRVWSYFADHNHEYEECVVQEQKIGALTISSGALEPAGQLFPAGSTGQVIGKMLFLAEHEAIEIREIDIKNLTYVKGNTLDRPITKLYLYKGNQAVAEAAPVGNNVSFKIPTGQLTIPFTKDQFVVTIKADLSPLGVGFPVKSGDNWQLQVSPANIIAYGVTSGEKLSSDQKSGRYEGNRHVLLKSTPLVIEDSVASQLFNGAEVPLYRFKVAANTYGDIGLYKVSFKISGLTNGLQARNFKLYETGSYGDNDLTNGGPRQCDKGSTQTGACYLNILFDTDGNGISQGGEYRIIPAGAQKTYELRADLIGVTFDSYIKVEILGEPSWGFIAGPETAVTIDADENYDAFIWSDLHYGNSSTTATSTAEWYNGWHVNGLDAISSSGIIPPPDPIVVSPTTPEPVPLIVSPTAPEPEPAVTITPQPVQPAPSAMAQEIKVLRDRIKNLKLKISELERQVVESEKRLTKKINKALTRRVKGRILLQVEENGEAWYVDPITEERFYLRDGNTAYTALQAFGLGITNKDLELIPIGVEDRAERIDTDNDGLDDQLEQAIGSDPNNPDTDNDGFNDGTEVESGYSPTGSGQPAVNQNLANRLEGRIVLQVENNGQAWYIHNGRRYYMKNGRLAYQIMRFLSLGITNSDLRQIGVGELE